MSEPPLSADNCSASAGLLARWQASGDPLALDHLLRIELTLLRDRIRRQGRSLLNTSIDASDAAQEAVMGLLRVERPPDFEDEHALRAYLWKSAWRLLRRRLGRPQRAVVRLDARSSQALAQDLADSAPPLLEFEDRAMAVNFALELLGSAEHALLVRFYYEHRTTDEISAELGISRKAAGMRLTRARAQLARKLEGWTSLLG